MPPGSFFSSTIDIANIANGGAVDEIFGSTDEVDEGVLGSEALGKNQFASRNF
jgi:hypothetical protein